MTERVNHPAHYNAHPSGVECIDVVEHMSFNLGNVVKYVWRADEKGAPIEDLRKAAWYLQREIDRRQGKAPESVQPRDASDVHPSLASAMAAAEREACALYCLNHAANLEDGAALAGALRAGVHWQQAEPIPEPAKAGPLRAVGCGDGQTYIVG